MTILTHLVLLFLASISPSIAQSALGVKSIVIVHRPFVDGSGWSGVYVLLKKSVVLPGHFADYKLKQLKQQLSAHLQLSVSTDFN